MPYHTAQPQLGLGCMSFGGFYGPTTEKEAHETLAMALDLGVTFWDTANVYGMGVSEDILGRFLKSQKPDITLATKAGIWRDKIQGNLGFNNKADYLRAELEGSLKRLGRERVDLFYVHRRDPDVEIEKVMQTLLGFKQEGLIGGIGFSEIAPSSLRRAAAVGQVDAVQSEYSLWTRQPELGLLQACEELDVTFVAFSPVGRGLLANPDLDPATFASSDFRATNPRFQAPHFAFNQQRARTFKSYAQDHGMTPGALSIAWCMAQGERVIPIPGTRTAGHLKDCAGALEITLTPDMLSEIESILPIGWAHGDRYGPKQINGPEQYC